MSGAGPPGPEPGDGKEFIRVTSEEVAAVVVTRPGPTRPLPEAPQRRRSQMATASLVLACLGVPLVGCLLGPVAILCGVLALGALQEREELTGWGLAIAGTALGMVELVGWIVALALSLSPSRAARVEAPPVFSAAKISDIGQAPEHIRRALQANVRVSCDDGRPHTGSGVLVGGGRLVLTNHHVAECTSGLEVVTAAGEPVAAVLRWTAPDGIDLSLLELARGPLAGTATVPLSPVEEPRIGDMVFAVGNPLGFESTYTAGPLSAVRSMAAGTRAVRILQIQAAINPGNSGGGVYTASGQLAGIVTWTADKSGGEGVGFAIAASELLGLLRQAEGAWVDELLAKDQGDAGGGP